VKAVKPGGCWWPNCCSVNGTLAGGVAMDPVGIVGTYPAGGVGMYPADGGGVGMYPAGGGGVGMYPAAAWLVAIASEDGNTRLNMSPGAVARPT